jgi:hypothetical protein
MRKGLFLVIFLTLFTAIVFAQTRKISGTVQGDNGAVIAGASITVKGSTKGTTTNNDGKFTIEVPTSGKPVLRWRWWSILAKESRDSKLKCLSWLRAESGLMFPWATASNN